MKHERVPGKIFSALLWKELCEIARDGRFRAVGIAVLGLLLVTLGLGFRDVVAVQQERRDAQATADDHFRTQDDKNPHVAAHYGTYVFKPAGALSFINPGVDAFVGVSLKLEAHKRNALEGARARDGTALARFSRLSVASVLELLVPLLVIAIGFGMWTSERERGTLRQLASLGVPPRSLLFGKTCALLFSLGALLVPALLLGGLSAWLFAPELEAPPGSGKRLGVLGLVYAAYVTVWAFLTLCVSASAKSSRGALVVMLGLWVGTSLIVPRVAADAAEWIVPVPSGEAVGAKIRADLATGLPGGPDREARIEQLYEAVLEEQGFKGAEMLMDASLLNGLELRAEAEFENEVLDHHFAALGRALDRQETLGQALALLSPVLAIRSLSMALAGTDAAHHRYFSERAEQHRRGLIDMLNREFAERGGAAGFDYKAGRELWERAPRFQYTPPGLSWVLGRQVSSLLLLAVWLVGAALGARWAVARIRVT